MRTHKTSPSAPSAELGRLLDEVKATVLALLASLQDKERSLRDQTSDPPSRGVTRGLSDIRALRRWADKTLHTIEILEKGQNGELHALLEELGEFGEIVKK